MGANSDFFHGAQRVWRGQLSSDSRIGVFERSESVDKSSGRLGSARNTVTVSLDGDEGRAFENVAAEALRALRADSAGLVKAWLDRALSDPSSIAEVGRSMGGSANARATDVQAPGWDVVVWLSDADLQRVNDAGLSPSAFVTLAMQSGILESQRSHLHDD